MAQNGTIDKPLFSDDSDSSSDDIPISFGAILRIIQDPESNSKTLISLDLLNVAKTHEYQGWDCLHLNPRLGGRVDRLPEYPFSVPPCWWIVSIASSQADDLKPIDWDYVDRQYTGQLRRAFYDCAHYSEYGPARFRDPNDHHRQSQVPDPCGPMSCAYHELLLFCIHLANAFALEMPIRLPQSVIDSIPFSPAPDYLMIRFFKYPSPAWCPLFRRLFRIPAGDSAK